MKRAKKEFEQTVKGRHRDRVLGRNVGTIFILHRWEWGEL